MYKKGVIMPVSSLNGITVFSMPPSYDPSKDKENTEKERKCKELKSELQATLNQLSFDEVLCLFEERGSEFVSDMWFANPWEVADNKGRSILEAALGEIEFNLSDDILLYLLHYLIEHSEQAKATHMNLLHILARSNSNSLNLVSLAKKIIPENPALLTARITPLGEGLDMTPAEMAIRAVNNPALMYELVNQYVAHVGVLPLEDKTKLLSHAEWLSGSAMYKTREVAKALIEHIKKFPEELPA